MNSFGKALEKAGIAPAKDESYDKGKSGALTLEMKLLEMDDHITAMGRILCDYALSMFHNPSKYQEAMREMQEKIAAN